MSYDASVDTNEQLKNDLAALAASALGQNVDVVADTGSGFLAVMAKKNKHIQQDVAAASEMYSLLTHFLPKLPLIAGQIGNADIVLSPGIHYDLEAGRVVLLIKVGEQELEYVAHWAVEGMQSNTVKAMAGLLVLPFAIEEHDGERHLIPEWFGAFYVKGNEDHCVPILTLRSVTQDERFTDWVAVALERMKVFGLPCDAAAQAIQQKTSH